MTDKTVRAISVAQGIILVLILVIAASFFCLGCAAEGIATVASVIALRAIQQSDDAVQRVCACLQINDELIQALEKIQQDDGGLEDSSAEPSGLEERDERS